MNSFLLVYMPLGNYFRCLFLGNKKLCMGSSIEDIVLLLKDKGISKSMAFNQNTFQIEIEFVLPVIVMPKEMDKPSNGFKKAQEDMEKHAVDDMQNVH